jgi:hypothetical protein
LPAQGVLPRRTRFHGSTRAVLGVRTVLVMNTDE